MAMTAAEHVAWAKDRALEYVDAGDASTALVSMMSDLSKHPDTSNHAAIELGALLTFAGHLQADAQVREWIEGIN